MDSKQLEREAKAMHWAARICPVLDVNKADDPDFGSGCFFQRGDQGFLVSAKHVLENVLQDSKKLLIPNEPSFGKKKTFVPFGGGELLRARRHDVAVVALKPHVTSRLKKAGWVFLTNDDVYKGEKISDCAIVGWPTETVTPKDPRARTFGNMPLLVDVPSIDPPEFATNIDVYDLFFLFKGENRPDMHGMSGAPIWSYRPADEEGGATWRPGAGYKLIGVDHAVMDGEYIRGTHWNVVDYLMRRAMGEEMGEPDEG